MGRLYEFFFCCRLGSLYQFLGIYNVGSKLHNLLVYLVWNEGIFSARMLQKSKGRFLKKIYPPGAVFQAADDG